MLRTKKQGRAIGSTELGAAVLAGVVRKASVRECHLSKP